MKYILLSLLMGMLVLNANEAKIQEKVEIAYNQKIKEMEESFKKLETFIKARNIEIEAIKKDIETFKEEFKDKESYVGFKIVLSFDALEDNIDKINEEILKQEKEIKHKYDLILIKQLDPLGHLDNFKKTQIEIYEADIMRYKAEVQHLKEQKNLLKH